MVDSNHSPRSSLAAARALQQTGKLGEAEAACLALLEDGNSRQAEIHALLGLVLFQNGRRDAGQALIGQSAEVEPDNAAWASDLGAGLFLVGSLARAREILEQASSGREADATLMSRLGVVCQAQGDTELAESCLREAVLRRPHWAAVHNNLAGVLMMQGKPDASLTHYDRALALQPDLQAAVKGRNLALVALDRADEAIADLERQLRSDPQSVGIRRRLARYLSLVERYHEAEERLHEARDLAPDDVQVLLELAGLLSVQDRHAAALGILEAAAEKEPADPNILSLLSRAYGEIGNRARADETIERALLADPQSAAVLTTRATVRSDAGEYDLAEADLRSVLETHPGAPDALAALGHNLMWTGRIDEAVECFERAAEINPAVLASLIEARAMPDDGAALETLVGLADNRLLPPAARAAMAFALVKAFESRGEHARAFGYADRANAIQRRTIDHDAASHSAYVDRIIETFTPSLFREHAGEGWTEEHRPVFVCGMPRSGTTLTEQVLASHPDVHGAGELGIVPSIIRRMPAVLGADKPYPDCMSLFRERTAEHAGGSYLKALRRLDDRAARVVDKLPHNFLHLGLIALIFPRARIIHVARDPRDVAISNYFTNFKHKRGLSYAFDLAEIGHMINDHDRIMAHWRAVLPVPIYDLRYEDLISDQEATSRALLRFVGLDWDADVLKFHETERTVKTASVWQVRQPIYTTSREKWRRYADFLAPLDEVLAQKPAAAAAE
jgi:tetratricopeptide (TPR) repeat protein